MKYPRTTVASPRLRRKCPDVATLSEKLITQLINKKELFFFQLFLLALLWQIKIKPQSYHPNAMPEIPTVKVKFNIS